MLIEVIEHASRDSEVLKKIFDFLNKGGFLIMSTRSINAPLHKLGLTRLHDKRVGHLRRYDECQLKKLVYNSGFKVIEIWKKEGVFSDFFFSFPKMCNWIVRIANRFLVASRLLALIDDLTLIIFGESQLIVIAKKNENRF